MAPHVLLCALALACSHGQNATTTTTAPEAADPKIAEAEPQAEERGPMVASGGPIMVGGAAAAAVGSKSPSELYEQCKARVEGPEKAGECTTDEDCTKAGCSSEACVSKATAAEGYMTGCEVLPCFAVLESCGCQEGLCTWTITPDEAEPEPEPAEPAPAEEEPKD